MSIDNEPTLRASRSDILDRVPQQPTRRDRVEVREPDGTRVTFLVDVVDGCVILEQYVEGEPEGYRGKFDIGESVALGAALIRAAGAAEN